MGTELREPRSVRDVGLAAGEALRVSGVDEHDLKGPVLEEEVERLPVVARRLHDDEGHLLGDQVLSKREDLVRHGPPGRHRRARSCPAAAGDAHAHLRVAFGDIDASTPGMDDVHFSLPSLPPDVRSGEGRKRSKSDARARWQQSTVPVGALHRHAELQAHRHYGGFGVQPRRTPQSGRSSRWALTALTATATDCVARSSPTPARTEGALRC